MFNNFHIIFNISEKIFPRIIFCDSIITNNKFLLYSFFDLTEYESPKQHIPHFLFLELSSFEGSN
jgi:hypothetical protein